MNAQIFKKNLIIGLIGAVLVLTGDFLMGYVEFPEGVNLLAGYYAAALKLPTWRPVLGGYLSFFGIALELPAFLMIADLIKEGMPKGAAFYRLTAYAYLALGGGAVRFPCGIFMWLFHTGKDVAGEAAGYELAFRYFMYFLVPCAALFLIFFIGGSLVLFVGFLSGKTSFPRWFVLFHPLIWMIVFHFIGQIGNQPFFHGIGTSCVNIGSLVMFLALLAGRRSMIQNAL